MDARSVIIVSASTPKGGSPLVVVTRGGEEGHLPPRAGGLAILNWPNPPKSQDWQGVSPGDGKRPKTLAPLSVKPYRWFGVAMPRSALARLERLDPRLHQHPHRPDDSRVEVGEQLGNLLIGEAW
jgi:hypothetical protein